MSALEFQKALALLIRLPEVNRGDQFDSFIANYDVSQHERSQLELLASDYNLQKYGRIMRGGRWQGFLRQLKILSHFVSDNLLEEINQKYYEPTAALHRARYYPIEFMRFLMEDAKARAILAKNAPAYIFDIVKYEHAQLQFRRQVFPTELVGDESMLQHQCFRVVDLSFDIPALLRQLSKIKVENTVSFQPEERAMHVLMIGDLEVPDFRTFEIDASVAKFLRQQQELLLAGKPLPLEVSLPKNYGDLVEIGLCKSVQAH